MRSNAALVVTLCLFTMPSAALATECPADTVHLVGQYYGESGLFVSTAPALDRSNYRYYTSPPTTAFQHAAYDLIGGSILSVASGTSVINQYMLHAEALVATHDVFRLIGPAGGAGASVSARLRLHIVCAGDTFSSGGTGYYIHAGSVTAHLGESGTTHRVSLEVRENLRDVRDLVLTFDRQVDETFTLRMSIRTEATAAPDNSIDEGFPRYAEAVGQLSFPDLPPGYSVVSCQGYAPDAPVPSRTTTWGRIKSLNH
ncbi:MAG: hypothetical protein ABL886_14870 [Rhodoglobus sp.]